MRGNDARFINHGCEPNLEVRKYQTLGDGLVEYEVGMWAVRDIAQGEEVSRNIPAQVKSSSQLFYNYNFDDFSEATDSLRAQCRCGAPTCIGYLGRKAGEKTGKEVSLEVESKKAAEAARSAARGRKGKKVVSRLAKKAAVKFSGAIQRAKSTLATRTAKASTKASHVATEEDQEAEEDDGQDQVIQEGDVESRVEHGLSEEAEEVENDGEMDELGASEAGDAPFTADWVDISMDDDHAAVQDGAVEVHLEAPPAPTANVSDRIVNVPSDAVANHAEEDFQLDQTSNDHPDGLVHKMINPVAEANVEATSESHSAEAAHTNPATIPRDVEQSASEKVIASEETFAPTSSTIAVPNASLVTTGSADTLANVPIVKAASAQSTNLAKAHAVSVLGVPDANGRIQPIITPGMTPAEVAAAKRKSGWANWLRKIAAEKTRTLEEWHEERIKRRRGITWMNMMIAEFGVAPSPVPASVETYSDGRKPAGSIGSFANSLAAQGHGPGPEGVRNLGGPKNQYRSDNYKKTKEEQMKAAQKAASAKGESIIDSGASVHTASPVPGPSGTSATGWTPDTGAEGSPVSHKRPGQATEEVRSEKRGRSISPTPAPQRSVTHSFSTMPPYPPPTTSPAVPRGQQVAVPNQLSGPLAYSQLAPSPAYPSMVERAPAHAGHFWRTALAPSTIYPAPVCPAVPSATPVQSTRSTHPQPFALVVNQQNFAAGSSSTSDTAQTAREAKEVTEKLTKRKEAIEKRNGAPKGWVYAPVEDDAKVRTEVILDLPRSARRARQSLGRDGSAPISTTLSAGSGQTESTSPLHVLGHFRGKEVTAAADGAVYRERKIEGHPSVDPVAGPAETVPAPAT